MDQMKQLDGEIEELEKAMLGNHSEVSESTEDSTSSSEGKDEKGVEDKEPEVVTTEEDTKIVEEPQKPKRTNWKKRFTKYKVSTDATIFSLRKDLADSLSSVESLQEQIDALKVNLNKDEDTFKSSFSDVDKDILGEDTINSMEKAINRAVKPFQEEISKLKQERAELIKRKKEDAATSATTDFLTKLADAVPDYEEIDHDPEFAKWLTGIEPISGQQRMYLFKVAERSGDVGRISSFMKEFKSGKEGINTTLESKINPSTTTSVTTTKKEVKKDNGITQEFIDKFYEDVIRGKYHGRLNEQLEIEKKIDSHFREYGMGG